MENIFESYDYKYNGLNRKEIEDKLYAEIMDALHKRYGASPDTQILKRVQEEWNAIQQADIVLDVAFMHEFISWMREEKHPWKHMDCSCFIFYLLKISEGNPLPAHVYCPSCGKIKWYPELPSGFDINFYTDEVDGDYIPYTYDFCECNEGLEGLICDGHNIAWQPFFYMDFIRYKGFTIIVPIEMETEMVHFLQEHWLAELDDAEPYYRRDDIRKINYSEIVFMFYLRREEYSESFFEKEGDMKFKKDMLSIWTSLVATKSEQEELYDKELPIPRTFGELIYTYGLFHCYGTWNELAQMMVRELNYSVASLIVFKDDVFHYYLRHGGSELDAWYGMEAAKFGNRMINIREEMRWAHDKWVLEFFDKFESDEAGPLVLWSKGAVVERLLQNIRKYYYDLPKDQNEGMDE